MPIDLQRVVEAAARAALDDSGSASSKDKPTKRRWLSAPRAILVGAGLFAGARLLMSARGRELIEAVQDRIAEYQDLLEGPADDEDAEPEDDGDYEDEPEAEYEEDEEYEPEDEAEEEYDPEDEYEDEEEPEDEYEPDEEEPEEEYDEEDEEESARPRAGSGARSNRRR
jgi:hypothetical protein